MFLQNNGGRVIPKQKSISTECKRELEGWGMEQAKAFERLSVLTRDPHKSIK